MSDNPMYWPGHQRPTWPQQAAAPTGAQQVNPMNHYASHPASMLSNPMAGNTMSSDPTLLMQSQIPGTRHQQSHLQQTVSPLAPQQQQQQQQPPLSAGQAGNLYPGMMPTGPGGAGLQAPSQQQQQQAGARQQASSQLNPNSHLSSSQTQGLSPHPGMQLAQPTHYPHQYSSYWNPPPINSQSASSAGPGPPPGSTQATVATGGPLSSAPVGPPGSDGPIGGGYPAAASFQTQKEMQASSYDRQRPAQHPSAMMQQNIPNSSASGLSPNQSQLSMQGRLKTQPNTQQPGSTPNWSNAGYYAQSTQSPYMNPYMTYGNSSVAPNHQSAIGHPPTRPSLSQKPSTNGNDRNRATTTGPYLHHAPTMYGQPPQPNATNNSSYYGYDSYYNQTAQDPYLTHQNPASAAQHWSSPASNSQMMSNNSTSSQLNPQTGASQTNVLSQSPSASTLPTIVSRPPASSQTPDRSPAPPQHSTSYPSPNQQSSSSKPASNSLAQLEQMVMPKTGSSAAPVMKSPTHRSSTSSPSTVPTQQPLQYSYNSSGQGNYFSAGANNSSSVQSSYYGQYESSGPEMKSNVWSDQTSTAGMMGSAPGTSMVDNSQPGYSQTGYDGSSSFPEYTALSTPGSNCSQPRFQAPDETIESHATDKSDPYAIDSQTFDDDDDQTSSAKTKKSRAKKGDDKVKKERKPRAPRAPKGGAIGVQPQSPSVIQPKPPSQIPEMVPCNTYAPLGHPVPTQVEPMNPVPEGINLPNIPPIVAPVSKSPAHRLSTESPITAPPNQQHMQYSSYSNSSQSNYYSSGPSIPPNQSNYYSQYESGPDMQKSWHGQSEVSQSSTPIQPALPIPSQQSSGIIDNNVAPYNQPIQEVQSTYCTSASESAPVPITDNLNMAATESVQENSELPLSQTPDEESENVLSSKSKKSRAKKTSDDKTKKERKPRAAKGSKASEGPQTVSPTSEPHPLDTSNNQQSTAATGSETAHMIDNSGRISTPVKSPRPNESKSTDISSQPGYPYNDSNQTSYYQSGPSEQGQIPSYFPSYDSGEFDPNSLSQNQSVPSDSLGQPGAFSNYLPSSSVQATDKDAETSIPVPDEQTEKSSIPKPKKSRPKRTNEEKAKRERKPKPPKVAVATPQVEQQADESKLSLTQEETTELHPSQELADSVPVDTPKPKRIRIRDSSSKGKKKLPKFALKFAKTKKRKRLGSSDNEQSDLDKTPPPSPDEVESGVQKRRSARNTKKLKYNDDIELGFSESDDDSPSAPKSKKSSSSIANVTMDGDSTMIEDSVVDEPTVFAAPVEDTMVVEKIMTHRTGKRELEPEPGEILPEDGTFIDVEEYYVKYKNLSYIHCDWRTLEELEKGDRRVSQKVKRYKQKKDSGNIFSYMDDELFDPQYCEVDRILAVNEVEEWVPESEDEPEKEDESKERKEPLEEIAAPEEVGPIEPNENLMTKLELEIEPKSSDEKSEPKSSDESKEPKSPTETEGCLPDGTLSVDEMKPEVVPKEDILDVDMKVEQEPPNGPSKEESTTEVAVIDNSNNAEVSGALIENEPEKASTDESNEIVPIKNSDVNPEKERKMKRKVSRHYLVKWRGLSYEDSTWELEDHLDVDKIKYFEKFKDPPPKSKWRTVKRPKPEEWVRKEASPHYKNNNTLREYQLEGLNWLSFCWHQGRNCILADEMGLGKTIQSIAFINEIHEHGINGPYLIIVPLSTVGNWAREFETWTDLNVITYHGSSTSREMLKEYEMFYRNEQGNRITSYYKFQVMITTFEIILSDCLDLREIPWRCCIIDEAHRLKNRNCKLLEGLRLLNMEHRVLLTGTPLQNNVEELFSLLNFLEPNQFSSTEQFLEEFGDLKTEAQVDKLKVILKPMMLRRLKEDVEKSLAPKEETIVEVELTNIQKKYYRAILEKNFSFLSKGSSSNNMPNLMNTMMELRKCCIHPYLINGAEEQILYEAKQTKSPDGGPMSSHQAMINSSGKLVLIDKLLPRLKADGHRVLIFSQMVRCLDILEDYITQKHYPFERIDGRVRGSDRQQAIDRFSKPGSDRFVFLLCTRAGGLGINLTAADTVIIFDSDWNPQNDLQAQARCHRIGQSKAVKIYRLICRNTYEREMFDKASLKLGLDKAVLQSMNTQKGAGGGIDGQLTKKEIEELLRKGAYGALMDDDNAGDKFCEEDIDHILLRRTQVITIDNSEAKGSTFSKATFSSSNNREDIELDDPNFWEKWAKKANFESDESRKDELIQLAPRRRTQTKRYGADGTLLDISELESSEEDEETISMRTRGGRSRGSNKLLPSSGSKRSKRSRFLDDNEDDEFLFEVDGGLWSKTDCLKLEKGLLTYGWGRWEEILANQSFKKEISIEDCENICRIILLYCLSSYKGDEKIKSFAWELICPAEESSKFQPDFDSSSPSRGRKPKIATIITKKTIAEEINDAKWPKDPQYDPLIALPDDQYRRHLQRNSNRLLIRVKFLHYLKNDILKGYTEKILSDCNSNEIDLPSIPVEGELPAHWWDDEADKSLLIGIFKHGHDKFNLMRQDPNLCFLQKCGPPNKEELLAEMNCSDRNEDLEDENQNITTNSFSILKNSNMIDDPTGQFLSNLVDRVAEDMSENMDHDFEGALVDENKNSIRKLIGSQDSLSEAYQNGVTEAASTKMDIATDEESTINEAPLSISKTSSDINMAGQEVSPQNQFFPFPSATDLNQRFRRLTTAYQRNSKRLEIKLAQQARDELKKERTSKFEAAKNEREERKRTLAQKWSRREEADFFRAISSFGVEYDTQQGRYDWNRFRAIGKLDKKLDETLDEYYKAFVIMCKKVTSKPLTLDEENCPINVDPITEERAQRCLTRIEFLSKIREQIINHPELDERLKSNIPQSDLPDWWENGFHDKDLLIAAAKHGLTRLDYNLAHDPSLSFDTLIKQKVEQYFSQPPSPILIPVEQLQELLDRNGIEYFRDEKNDETDDVKQILDALIDSIESDESDELTDSQKGDEESADKSSIASRINKSGSSRSLSNIVARRGSNTIVKSADTAGPNPNSVRLEHTARFDDRGVIEITPLMPNNIPEDPIKNFEAGEISISVQSESALLQLDGRAPMILFGATNPITCRIRWPKDRAIQTRLENLVHLVERNEWPLPPKPSLPVITLPSHMTANMSSTPLSVSTTPPSKNDKSDVPIGSPNSDISNVSTKASNKDSAKETGNDSNSARSRRGRGRKPKQSDTDQQPQQQHSIASEYDLSRDDNQAAKLRNLLSQNSASSSKSSGSSDKLTTKFGSNKQGAGLSSLLASFKQKRNDPGNSSLGHDDRLGGLDLNGATANLLPQILANMKPEFRDLLANQDAATMLLNSLSGLTGVGGTGLNLRGSNANVQMSIESLLNPLTRSSSSKTGPPPAHQAPAAHGSTTRELRSNSQNARENSPPSVNLRSTRGKSSHSSGLHGLGNDQRQSELDHLKQSSQHQSSGSSKRRGRPSSDASNSPPAVGADVLDLSSLPLGVKLSSSRTESRSSRRHRDDEHMQGSSTRSGSSSSRSNQRQSSGRQTSELDSSLDTSERGGRLTRASKRIGSRIDALALNLQAKRLNRGDSPSSDAPLSPPSARDVRSSMGGDKSSSDRKNHGSKAPPAAHSSSHRPGVADAKVDKPSSQQILPTPNLTTQTQSNNNQLPRPSQDPLASLMSNPAALLGGLNPASLGNPTDLVNQLLRKPGSNDMIKNLLNEFMKNPALALNSSELMASLASSMPLPNFNLPAQQMPPTSLQSSKNSSSSLLNDFKSPVGSSLMKRARQESGSGSGSSRQYSGGLSGVGSSGSGSQPSSESRRSSSTPDRQERRSSDRRGSGYSDRPEKHTNHDKRPGSSNLLDSSSDSLSRRSSSSLLAQQNPNNQSVSQTPITSATGTSQMNTFPTAAQTLNMANQFGGLNSLSGLLNFPGMNELMKHMNLPGLGTSLPRMSGAPASSPTTSLSNPTSSNVKTNSTNSSSNSDKSRRPRQSGLQQQQQQQQQPIVPPQSMASQQQQAANAALANSIMSLASQQPATTNPYNFNNPLSNPFLSFGLPNLNMSNPLAGMGLFPNLYMPPGFPTPDQQQQMNQGSGGSNDAPPKDKKMRYPRK